jgi:uncharacterized protein (TIGR02996 family)
VTDDAAFLAAILAEPADDTARLVYADYLDEHDDPVRAAVVRAGVADPREEFVFLPYALVDRSEYWVCKELWKKWPAGGQTRLRDELPKPSELPWLVSLAYRRGFVDLVRLPWEAWRERADWLRKTWPLTRVDLTTEPDLDPDYDGRRREWFDVVAGEEVRVPERDMPAHRHLGNMVLLSARWPGLTFTSPGSRRADAERL